MPNLMDIGALADHLGVSVRHIRRLVAQRRIPYIKWGNLLRFDPNAIAEWLAEKVIDPNGHGRRDRPTGQLDHHAPTTRR